MMEWWNVGFEGILSIQYGCFSPGYPLFHYSIIPLFQYSIIPVEPDPEGL